MCLKLNMFVWSQFEEEIPKKFGQTLEFHWFQNSLWTTLLAKTKKKSSKKILIIHLPSGLAGAFSGLRVTPGPILTFTIRITVDFRWPGLTTIFATKKNENIVLDTKKMYDYQMFSFSCLQVA